MEMLPSLTRWLKTHDLLVYFLLTFLITWSAWITVILTLPVLDTKYLGTGGMLLEMLGMWGPALSAILVAALTRGKLGLKEIFSRLKYRRGSARWFLAAFLLWSAIWLAMTLWQARVTDQALSFHWNQWTRIFSLLISALPLLFWGCEEIGWRGFALPRLLNRVNALIASVILGLVWGAWHLPIFIWNIKGLSSSTPFYIYLVYTISISVVMTWLLNHTQGSLLVAIFFHFWINDWPRFQYALLPVEDPGGSTFVMSTWLMAAFAVLVVVTSGYRSFNRNPKRSELAGLTTSKA
jgi:membrane protease YdiL (CAAX protease family)